MKIFFVALLLCITHYSFSLEPPFSEAILKYAQNNLSNFGTLKNKNGLIYVDLDDKYIYELLQFIEKSGFQKPPYFEGTDLVGAHITVIDPNEMEQYNIQQIDEMGTTIFFQLVECKLIIPPNWNEIDRVYLIVIDSPQLDHIRKKYRLPNRDYMFHITIGVKPKTLETVFR